MQEGNKHDDQKEEPEQVQVVLLRQIQWFRREIAIQLAEGDDAARQCHSTDEVPKECRDILHARPGSGVRPIRADGGAHRGQADQGVECGDRLWESDWAHLTAPGESQQATDAHQTSSDSHRLSRQARKSSNQGTEDTDHAELTTCVGCLHGCQRTDGGNAEQGRDAEHRLQQLSMCETTEDHQQTRQKHQRGEVLVPGPLEEVQHAL
mmetsp:Transcript_39631/g.100670  ORF Transcript_39631/g.100670 Transcript_39631/m.100670 type:complete len:208 (+) Transcript_39631:1186-1809(+)